MRSVQKVKEKYKKVLQGLEYEWDITHRRSLQGDIDKEALGKCMEKLNKLTQNIIDKGFRDIL